MEQEKQYNGRVGCHYGDLLKGLRWWFVLGNCQSEGNEGNTAFQLSTGLGLCHDTI